jgi:hypothetical protein
MSQRAAPTTNPEYTFWRYILSLGIPLSLLAWGLEKSSSSWLGVTSLYIGAILFVASFPFEWWVNSNHVLWIRAGLGAISLIGLLIWHFLPAPLTISSESRLPGYLAGTDVAGIRWSQDYSEFTVRIQNQTDEDYSNLEALIETDLVIEELKATENYANCSVFPHFPPVGAPRVTSQWVDPQGHWHTSESVPSDEPPKSGWTYRLTCTKFPHLSEINLIGALQNQNFKLEIGQPLLLPPRPARWVKVNATYEFRRPRKSNHTDCFSGDCADSLAPPSEFRHDPETTITMQKEADSRFRATVSTVITVLLIAALLLSVFLGARARGRDQEP